MKSTIEDLFIDYRLKEKNCALIAKLKSRVSENKCRLNKNLGKHQEVLLLEIEDGQNLIAEISSTKSFIAGFKMALKIGLETSGDCCLCNDGGRCMAR